MDTETRYVELRADGERGLSGTVVRYGSTASLPWGEERFEPGAFGDVSDIDAVLNRQHDRTAPLARTPDTMQLTDTPSELRMSASLPRTADADDTLALVRARVLRGLSLEFRAVSERMEADVRVIEEAELVGIGVVDRPAYDDSLVTAMRAQYGPAPQAPLPRIRVWL